MNLKDKFIILFTGLALIIVLASVFVWILGRRMKNENMLEIIENLKSRVRLWWIMAGIFTFAFFVGREATLVLFALTSFFALREFITLTPTRAADHRALIVTFFLLIPTQYYLIGINWYGLFSIFIPVYGFLILPILSALSQDTENFIERAAKMQWGVMIGIYCISYVPALLLLQIPGYEGQNVMLLFFLLFVLQVSDVLQIVLAKIFGKTRIASIPGSSKTREGLIVGATIAVLVGTSMWWITPFTPLQACAISGLIVLMGCLGNIVMSAVKQGLGVTAWGTLIKGQGGMLDRMDSVCFAAPIFFHVTRYFFTS